MVMGLAGSKGPSVFNAHERTLPASVERVGALMDRLGSSDDPLWPSDRWPPLELDKPLSLGARGGHGPIRYHVVEHEPGQMVRFKFSAPPGFLGYHEFLVERAGSVEASAARLRHVLVITPLGDARYTWPLVWRPLHDALMEDLMDRAESAITGEPVRPRGWPWYVRALRSLLAGRLQAPVDGSPRAR